MGGKGGERDYNWNGIFSPDPATDIGWAELTMVGVTSGNSLQLDNDPSN